MSQFKCVFKILKFHLDKANIGTKLFFSKCFPVRHHCMFNVHKTYVNSISNKCVKMEHF